MLGLNLSNCIPQFKIDRVLEENQKLEQKLQSPSLPGAIGKSWFALGRSRRERFAVAKRELGDRHKRVIKDKRLKNQSFAE
ncbi:MAG: hypothetical protein AB4372_31935 [Xenococcus sp. (in: cyanobacteria)]